MILRQVSRKARAPLPQKLSAKATAKLERAPGMVMGGGVQGKKPRRRKSLLLAAEVVYTRAKRLHRSSRFTGVSVMKVIGLKLALHTALLAIFFAGVARADDTDTSAHSKRPAYSKQALQSKIEYCQTCHGPSGQGARGSIPIPRLAGQQIKYVENQLRNFIIHRRQHNVMSNAVQGMSPAEITALATYFSELNPKPVGGAPRELAAAGKKIYEEGLPEANVPACMSCHGPLAKGNGEFPRLAGQLNDYILKKLTNWEKEWGQDPAVPDKSAAVMKPVAHNLSDAQVAAVAAYLSYLE